MRLLNIRKRIQLNFIFLRDCLQDRVYPKWMTGFCVRPCYDTFNSLHNAYALLREANTEMDGGA